MLLRTCSLGKEKCLEEIIQFTPQKSPPCVCGLPTRFLGKPLFRTRTLLTEMDEIRLYARASNTSHSITLVVVFPAPALWSSCASVPAYPACGTAPLCGSVSSKTPYPATEHPKTKCQLTTRGKWNRNTLHWQTVQALPANKGIRRVRPPFSLASRIDLELPLLRFLLPHPRLHPKVKCRLIWSEWVRGRWEPKDVTEKRTEARYTPLISSIPWLPFARSAEPYREPSMKCCKELILSRLCCCLERSTAYWDEYILAGSARKIDRLSTAHLRAMGENQATARRAQHQ